MYHNFAVSFPNDKLVLQRWLGPAIDIGPAMCAKILKPNGNAQHISTYHVLTPEEYKNKDIQARMAEFTLKVEAAIGPAATEADFVDKLEEFQTPTFKPYEDEDTKPTVIPDRDVLTPLTNT